MPPLVVLRCNTFQRYAQFRHKGVAIRLKSGNKYLVGMQDVHGMEAALKRFAKTTVPETP